LDFLRCRSASCTKRPDETNHKMMCFMIFH